MSPVTMGVLLKLNYFPLSVSTAAVSNKKNFG